MRWRLVVVLALVAAFGFGVVPSSAFELGSMTRTVGANVVATGSAYSAITTATCVGDLLQEVTCSTSSVTNKGTGNIKYRLYEESDPNGKVSSYGINGGPAVTGDWTAYTAEIGIGNPAAFNLRIPACPVGCSDTVYATHWTVEGQLSGTIDFTATRILVNVDYP